MCGCGCGGNGRRERRGFEKRLRKPSRNWCSLALPAVVAATEVKTAYRAEMLIHTCVVMSVVWTPRGGLKILRQNTLNPDRPSFEFQLTPTPVLVQLISTLSVRTYLLGFRIELFQIYSRNFV